MVHDGNRNHLEMLMVRFVLVDAIWSGIGEEVAPQPGETLGNSTIQ